MDRILTPTFQHPFIVLVFVSSVQFCPVCMCQQSGGEPRGETETREWFRWRGQGDTELLIACNHPFFPTMLAGWWIMCEPTVKAVSASCSCGLGDADIMN